MKKLFVRLTGICGILLGALGCNLLESHPYEVNVNYRDLNRQAMDRIESECSRKSTIRYVWMGDTHRWYDETEDFVKHVNARQDIDFVLHGGDVTDFGLGREYEWIHKTMRKLHVPYVALIGNHDILGNGLDVYEKMYGDLNFSFIAGTVKFVCVNTNALEFDYSYAVPDFGFLTREREEDPGRPFEQTVVAMHANPYGEQFNNNVAPVFQGHLRRLKNLRFCMHAHAHKLMVTDFFEDGITYYGCAAMKDRNYLVFTITPEEYSYEVVYY
ncbi:MAG: metallophosphoesterase [Rikenellaceae bacterium]|nr:metallophosphoesterase [Rikenellaceae bacterium]